MEATTDKVTRHNELERPAHLAAPSQKKTKKEQIILLYSSGIKKIDELARLSQSQVSYVASVLQEAGLLAGYFDLYTGSAQTMNLYSRHFKNRLGFRTPGIARRSVQHIDRVYSRFRITRDRAGQHHALAVALTMFNRARWTGKFQEAAIFRQWLIFKLYENEEILPDIPH